MPLGETKHAFSQKHIVYSQRNIHFAAKHALLQRKIPAILFRIGKEVMLPSEQLREVLQLDDLDALLSLVTDYRE